MGAADITICWSSARRAGNRVRRRNEAYSSKVGDRADDAVEVEQYAFVIGGAPVSSLRGVKYRSGSPGSAGEPPGLSLFRDGDGPAVYACG